MKRFVGALVVTGLGALLFLAGGDAAAQSGGSQAAELSKEWPTYGHDPGAMRFSPLTQLTPANVNQLKVAWVYHMRPPGEPAAPPAIAAPPAGRGGDIQVGETPVEAGGGRR